MSSPASATTEPENDPAAARVDAEARHAATRHSSDFKGEPMTSKEERERKIERVERAEKRMRRVKHDNTWQRPMLNTKSSAYWGYQVQYRGMFSETGR